MHEPHLCNYHWNHYGDMFKHCCGLGIEHSGEHECQFCGVTTRNVPHGEH